MSVTDIYELKLMSVLTGLTCLALVARHHDIELGIENTKHKYSLTDEPDAASILTIATDSGLTAGVKQMTWDELISIRDTFPMLARLINGNWVVLAGIKSDQSVTRVQVIDPLSTKAELLELEESRFSAAWDGDVILLKREAGQGSREIPFGLRWFWPEIYKHRRIFIEVIVCALVLHVLSLSVPVFMQISFDKVLTNNALDTLYVLTTAVVGALVFNQVLEFLKGLMLLHVTSKIDVKTSSTAFQKLTSLPIDFFRQSSAGMLTKHMQQSSVVREFLTGRLFNAVLDLTTLLVYLPVLTFYSASLTGIVVLFALLIGSVSLLVMGPYRRRLQALYRAEGDRQALLVESIAGMETVKALSLEPRKQKSWDQSTAESVATNVSVKKISLSTSALTGFLQKLLTIAIIFIGIQFAFTGALSLGELIAFNILASRVISPIVSAIGLISEYQQTALSIQMLGQVMNQKGERHNQSGLTPQFRGNVSFEDVYFRYESDGQYALNGVSFSVKPGQVVGIVGRSGSGKSTIASLIQGMYRPERGIIRIDGVDLRELDLTHWRLNTSIVLQEAFMFAGTVRQNIGSANPAASFAEIVKAAQTAGADQFIEQLPHGYETVLQEGASNLSGGQKQRLAIARALISDPRFLIFDEATSALDPESEAIVLDNMPQIVKGKTVFVVSHRLASLIDCDKILVVDDGRIVDSGRHAQLYQTSLLYRQLWDTQHRHQMEAAV